MKQKDKQLECIVTMRQDPELRYCNTAPPVCHEADPGEKRGKGESPQSYISTWVANGTVPYPEQPPVRILCSFDIVRTRKYQVAQEIEVEVDLRGGGRIGTPVAVLVNILVEMWYSLSASPSMQGATFIPPPLLHHHQSLHVTMLAERG